MVDDGSTDGTRACAERFAARDGKVEVKLSLAAPLVAGWKRVARFG